MSVRRRRTFLLLRIYLALGLFVAWLFYHYGNQPAERVTPEQSVDAAFHHDVMPLLTQYCYTCHSASDGQKPAADLALDHFRSADSVLADGDARGTWDLASKYVRSHQMPPDDHPQPTDAERRTITQWVDGRLFAYYAANPDPGKVTIHRMNRSEYDHTVQDLVGVHFEPGEDFPQDDSGYGFDNIGDVLSLPPVLMEKYLSAADRVMDAALPSAPPASKVRHVPASQAEIGFNALGDRGDGWVHLISLEEDDAAVTMDLPAGDYIFRVKAFAEPTGGGLVGQGSSVPLQYTAPVPPTKLGVFVGSTFVQDWIIDGTEAAPKVYEARIGLPGGRQRISASVRRNRGGADNEVYMLNGRIGTQQPGVVFVKYLEVEGPLPAAIHRYPAKTLQTTGVGAFDGQGNWIMQHNGEAAVTLNVPKAGDYILRAEVSANQAGKDPVKMEFRVNGKAVQSMDVLAPATLVPVQGQRLFDINLLNARPYVYEIHQNLPGGEVKFSAAFVNDLADPSATNPNLLRRNLILDYLEVVDTQSPLPTPAMPELFAAYFSKPVEALDRTAAQDIVRTFATRAFRRPATPTEINRLMKLYDMAAGDGETPQNSLRLALKAVLVSPNFLFRGEVMPDPNNPRDVHDVDEFALASRLSYFLWSSMPDDELLGLAEKHQLRANLETQVKRMMASPKSAAFVENFAGQWLQLRNLAGLAPDKTLFKDFDDSLRRDMQHETELLFDSIMRQDQSVMSFLTADYTFVNGRLARFYGLDSAGVSGDQFVKVSLAQTPRRGVLTQGSILTLTSNPTRTSPVKRGKFVLENLMGTPPPPPPPDVPKLEETKLVGGTLRQQMEVHRQNPVCASCHAQMDPIGFGLENFDAVGKWRDMDGAAPVDAAGVLKTGESFKTAAQLVEILANKRRDDFEQCLTEKMLTYALGRGVEPFDRPAVADIMKRMQANDDRFSELVLGIAESLPFQKQRGEAPPG